MLKAILFNFPKYKILNNNSAIAVFERSRREHMGGLEEVKLLEWSRGCTCTEFGWSSKVRKPSVRAEHRLCIRYQERWWGRKGSSGLWRQVFKRSFAEKPKESLWMPGVNNHFSNSFEDCSFIHDDVWFVTLFTFINAVKSDIVLKPFTI